MALDSRNLYQNDNNNNNDNDIITTITYDMSSLLQMMAWCRLGTKPLSEPVMA